MTKDPASEPAEGRALRRLLRVKPGTRIRLDSVDASATYGFEKETAARTLESDLKRLTEVQERLWAESRQRLLIVLQGIDTAGKGGTIEHVMGAFNPQGCHVHGFKVPTEDELARDFLWRVHARVPRSGEVVIFDRSHYEEVLVVRVHELVPKERWSRRYDHINAFERLLADEGTRILKFFLYIDRDEQRQRLQARFDDPSKRWKFRLRDLEERRHWDDYIAAYEDVLEGCSTEVAPWFVIPANRKWFRNLAVSRIVAETLEDMNPQLPVSPDPLPEHLVIE